jgi:hypothetical protein
LLGEERGTLFEAGNRDDCIRSLDWAIHHPQKVAAMAESAQKHIEIYYNWDRITSENLKLYTPFSRPNVLDTSNRLSRRLGTFGSKSVLTGTKANTSGEWGVGSRE